MQAKDASEPLQRSAPSPAEPSRDGRRPLLLVDIDGVISLFGQGLNATGERRSPDGQLLEGSFHSIEGIPHFFSSTAAAHLLELSPLFELVWASGWEERANEHLPQLLGLPAALPFLRFSAAIGVAGGAEGTHVTRAHWKLESIDAYAGDRPLAWIDDAFNPACHQWAAERAAPTLLVQSAPEHGLTAREARLLAQWAEQLQARPQPAALPRAR
jgi:hypothetical protein